jgi:hypothetical protein
VASTAPFRFSAKDIEHIRCDNGEFVLILFLRRFACSHSV